MPEPNMVSYKMKSISTVNLFNNIMICDLETSEYGHILTRSTFQLFQIQNTILMLHIVGINVEIVLNAKLNIVKVNDEVHNCIKGI